MRGIIYLFVRNGGWLTFFLLEGICLFLIVRFNQSQREIFWHSANLASGSVNNLIGMGEHLLAAERIADSLAEENARLKAKLGYSRFDMVLRMDTIKDEDQEPKYRYIAADVINNSVTRHNNHMTLNRGALHGVQGRMGVVSDKGPVGIVRNTSTHFAQVLSILHHQMRLSAELKKTGDFGTLVWNGTDPKLMTLREISRVASMEKGDTVVTTGFSTHFPPSLMVGTIDTVLYEKGSSFKSAKVRLVTDMGKLKSVYVVENLMAKEQKELEAESQ